MISLDDYFGIYANHPEASAGKWSIADILLEKVNGLLEEAQDEGIELEENPVTHCPVGAPLSAHKMAHAVDIYDPTGKLDEWITDEMLTKHKLWRESPTQTATWVHLQDVPPKSGKRTFFA